jgi:hypothetical protein
VQPFHGSRVVLDFGAGFGPADTVAGVGAVAHAHYELWATLADGTTTRLAPFAVQPVVDPASPCLIYDQAAAEALPGASAGALVMAPDAPGDPPALVADRAWLRMRVTLLAGNTLAATSVSDGYAGVTTIDPTRCAGDDCWLDDAEIAPGSLSLVRAGTPLAEDSCPPASGHFCADDAAGRVTLAAADRTGPLVAQYRAHLRSPQPGSSPAAWAAAARLAACQAHTDPAFYLGNAVQMTAPFGGQLYGLIDSTDPTTGLPLGGAILITSAALTDLDHLTITVETDAVARAGANDPRRRGPTVLEGPAMFGAPGAGRGVWDLDLQAPDGVTFAGTAPTAHATVLAGLDRDDLEY